MPNKPKTSCKPPPGRGCVTAGSGTKASSTAQPWRRCVQPWQPPCVVASGTSEGVWAPGGGHAPECRPKRMHDGAKPRQAGATGAQAMGPKGRRAAQGRAPTQGVHTAGSSVHGRSRVWGFGVRTCHVKGGTGAQASCRCTHCIGKWHGPLCGGGGRLQRQVHGRASGAATAAAHAHVQQRQVHVPTSARRAFVLLSEESQLRPTLTPLPAQPPRPPKLVRPHR